MLRCVEVVVLSRVLVDAKSCEICPGLCLASVLVNTALSLARTAERGSLALSIGRLAKAILAIVSASASSHVQESLSEDSVNIDVVNVQSLQSRCQQVLVICVI